MTSTPDADERLLGAHDLALAALREITPESTVGPAAGYTVEQDGSVSLRFANRLAGYPGWYWTVTVARVDEEDPTVLEVELLPGEGALLAPEWVPWDERLAEYRAHQVELAEQAAADGSLIDAEAPALDEELDDDEVELDEDDDLVETDILHAGDLDGVDIDELDESADDDELESVDDDELADDEDADDEDADDEE